MTDGAQPDRGKGATVTPATVRPSCREAPDRPPPECGGRKAFAFEKFLRWQNIQRRKSNTQLPMNRPTPDPSQEGSRHASARRKFPSWEGLGVGSWSQCMRKSDRKLPINRCLGNSALDVGR